MTSRHFGRPGRIRRDGIPGLVAEQHAAFVGTVPLNYDRYLGPLLFVPYADDLAARLPVAPGTRVLEVACGTGIVTERLVRRLAGQGTLVATDLNDAMIAHARARIPADPALEWRQADGTSLPFPDGAFDVVVCEFGLMFFPDKAAGVREAFRVLRPGGTYLFNVWDAHRAERRRPDRARHDRHVLPGRPAPVLPGSVQPPRHRGRAGSARRRGLRRRGERDGGEGGNEPVGRGCGHRARRGQPGDRRRSWRGGRTPCPTSGPLSRGTSPPSSATTRCGPPSGPTSSRPAARAGRTLTSRRFARAPLGKCSEVEA